MSSFKDRKLKTQKLVVSAMLCAIGVIILAIGAFADVLDLSVSVLASVLCIWAVIEIGGAYPWLIWLVTSVLGLLLLPMKNPAIYYAFFTGYYPILKEKLEHKFRPAIAMPIKLLSFHVAILLIYGFMRLFLPSQLEGLVWDWLLLGAYVLLVVTFILYDYALTKLITGYLFRLRQYLKFKS